VLAPETEQDQRDVRTDRYRPLGEVVGNRPSNDQASWSSLQNPVLVKGYKLPGPLNPSMHLPASRVPNRPASVAGI